MGTVDDVLQELRAINARLERLESNELTAYTVHDAARRLGCGRSKVFELIQTGELQRANGRGRKTLVTSESVDALLLPVRRETSAPRARVQSVAEAQAQIRQAMVGLRRSRG